MAQRAVPAPFLKKTYEFVDDRSSDDVVSWSESGTTFVVWNSGDFAKEMLPKFFKHNNFSSFVRQLNTYGFRKTATDKWEFANDNFKRGQKELLTQIRRRKTVTSIQAAKKSTAVAAPSSSSNSGDDLRSSSMSSPASKIAQSVEAPASAHFTELSIENEKLKRHNELLSSEIAQAKKQCGELVAFLNVCEKLAPDQINRIIRQGSYGSTIDGLNGLINAVGTYESDGADDDDENRGVKGKEYLKLFGVWVRGNEKKRGREEEMGFGGANRKEMKTVDLDFDFDVPWRKIVCSPRETSKVCN